MMLLTWIFFLIFHGQVQTCSHGSHTNCQTGELFILNMYVIGNQQSYQHDLLAVLPTTAGKGREVDDGAGTWKEYARGSRSRS